MPGRPSQTQSSRSTLVRGVCVVWWGALCCSRTCRDSSDLEHVHRAPAGLRANASTHAALPARTHAPPVTFQADSRGSSSRSGDARREWGRAAPTRFYYLQQQQGARGKAARGRPGGTRWITCAHAHLSCRVVEPLSQRSPCESLSRRAGSAFSPSCAVRARSASGCRGAKCAALA